MTTEEQLQTIAAIKEAIDHFHMQYGEKSSKRAAKLEKRYYLLLLELS